MVAKMNECDDECDEEKLINSLTFNIGLAENRHILNGIGFRLLEQISFVATLQGIDKSKNHCCLWTDK